MTKGSKRELEKNRIPKTYRTFRIMWATATAIQPTTPKDSSEEFFFRRGSDPHGVGLNPAGESRAGMKKPLECAGNRKTVEVGRTGFVGMRVRRTPPRNCLLQRFGMRRAKKPLDTAPALCFALLPSYNCPPAVPAVCSVAMRKDALLILSRHVSLYFTAALRSVLGRGFVLFRSGGKTSIQYATPAVLKEKECI